MSYDTAPEYTTIRTDRIRDLEAELATARFRLAVLTENDESFDSVVNHNLDLKQQLAAAVAERDEARRTAEYWKAEHRAANVEVERLTARCLNLRELAEEVEGDCRCRCEEAWRTRGLHAPECHGYLSDMAQERLEGKR